MMQKSVLTIRICEYLQEEKIIIVKSKLTEIVISESIVIINIISVQVYWRC